MKILICTETYYPYVSGVVTHIETLKGCLENAGHQVMIVCTYAGQKGHELREDVLYSPGVCLKKIYGYGLAWPRSKDRMEIIRGFGPDIVHVHTEFSQGLFAIHVAKELGIPLVYTMHTFYDDYVTYITGNRYKDQAQVAARRYARYFAGKADEVIAPSYKIADYLLRAGHARKCNIVPNVVMTDLFRPQNVDARRVAALKHELGIEEQDACLCYVGRLGPEKSISTLVDHFIKGFAGEHQYKLFIIGDGPQRQELDEMVAQADVASQVHLLGPIDHALLPLYYQCFSIFSTASLSEVHSISLLEAQAAGLYAVNRLDEQNRGQITEGVTGEFFETVGEFEKAVRGFAQRTPIESQNARAIISDVSCRYGPQAFADAVEQVYYKALASERRLPAA